MDKPSIARGSRNALKHGQFLLNEATGLYEQRGLMVPYFVPLTRGTQQTQFIIFDNPRRSETDRLLDVGANVFSRLLGGSAINGLCMSARQIDISAEPNSDTSDYWFLVKQGSYGHRNRFGTTVFEPTGLVGDRSADMQTVEDPKSSEIAGDFINSFLELTPDDILVLQNGELSDVEKHDSVTQLFGNYRSIVEKLGSTPNEMKANHERVHFMIDNLTRVVLDISATSTTDTLTEKSTREDPTFFLFISGQNPDNYITLGGFDSGMGRSVLASVHHDDIIQGESARSLNHDEIIGLVKLVGDLNNSVAEGRIIPDSAFDPRGDAEYEPQPIAPIDPKRLALIHKILGENENN